MFCRSASFSTNRYQIQFCAESSNPASFRLIPHVPGCIKSFSSSQNGVAQRRGRFKELCRRGGKAPLFFQGIQDHEDIQQWFHRYPLTVCESPLADHSIGITSGSGYWYSNPSSLQIRLPSTILPWPPSGLSLNTGGGRPSSRAICG